MKPNPKHISTINRINKFKNPTIQINWLLTSLIFTILVSGHGFPKSLTIGGKPFKICTEQGENNVNIGSIGWGFTGNGPVESFDSPSMVCNEMGGKIGPTPKTYAAVNAGDKVEVNWGPKWPESHLGPKDFWLGRCKNDCVGEDVTELSWFKIGEIGFDNGKWHHMEPIDSCTLPTDIKDGHWILRHTRIALHATGSPQIYAHCYRLQISGGGSEEPEGIKIPDDLDKKSEGFMVNVWYPPITSYTCPGPPVYGSDKGKTDKGKTDKGQTDKGQTDKGQTDKGQTDKGQTDKGQTDKGQTDKGQTDKGQTDKGYADKGQPDKGQPDKGQPDKGYTDKGQPDNGQPDKGQPDKGQIDKGQTSGNNKNTYNTPVITGRRKSCKSKKPKPKKGKTGKGKTGKGKTGKGKNDKGKNDKGQPDKGQPDKGQPDKGQPDKGQPDKGQPDKGQPDKVQPGGGKDTYDTPIKNGNNVTDDVNSKGSYSGGNPNTSKSQDQEQKKNYKRNARPHRSHSHRMG